MKLQLKNRVDSFDFFSMDLDKSRDVRDTTQLLVFVHGIITQAEIKEDLTAMHSKKEMMICSWA